MARKAVPVLVAWFLLGRIQSLAVAGMWLSGPVNFITAASPPDGGGTVTLSGGNSLLMTLPAPDINLLQQTFPKWNFTVGNPTQVNGRLDIQDFEATATDDLGGAHITAGYSVAQGDPPLENLEWIQIVSTDAPLNGKGSPFVDAPAPTQKNPIPLPFYFTPDENTGKKAFGEYGFTDNARRHYPDPPIPPSDDQFLGMAGRSYTCVMERQV